MTGPGKPRWRSYSLRTLLLLTLVAALLSAYVADGIATYLQRKSREAPIRIAVQAAGGTIEVNSLQLPWYVQLATGAQTQEEIFSVQFRDQNEFEPELWEVMGKGNALAVLKLVNCRLSADDLTGIGGLKALKHLELKRCERHPGGTSDMTLTSVEFIWLERTKLEAKDYRDLVDGSDRIKSIYVDEIPEFGDVGTLRLVARNAKLESLFLYHTASDDDGMRNFESHPNLRKVHLSSNQCTDRTLGYLATCPKLQELVCYEPGISAEGIRQFRSVRPAVQLQVRKTIVNTAAIPTETPPSQDSP